MRWSEEGDETAFHEKIEYAEHEALAARSEAVKALKVERLAPPRVDKAGRNNRLHFGQRTFCS